MFPTKVRLSNIIPNLQPRNCPLCNEKEETMIHLFIECPTTRICNHLYTMTSKQLATKPCLIVDKFIVRLDTNDNQYSTGLGTKCLRNITIPDFRINSAGFYLEAKKRYCLQSCSPFT